MERNNIDFSKYLDSAHGYAVANTGCKKVAVGSLILNPHTGEIHSFGANRAIPNLCKDTECMRIQKYGEDSKNHRLPSDCRAIHSELDAIINSQRDVSGCVIVVTRYPCEACARAIVRAGITTVVYGRKQKISEETEKIFDLYGVRVIHNDFWDADDTER